MLGLAGVSSPASAHRARTHVHYYAAPLLYVSPTVYYVYPNAYVYGGALVARDCRAKLRAWRLSRPRYWTVADYECR
jgi:hypothetical protein